MSWLQEALLKAAREAEQLPHWALRIEAAMGRGQVIAGEPEKLNWELLRGLENVPEPRSAELR